MASFNGKWLYRSFCPAPGTTERAPQITAPWSPVGTMDVVSDAEGRVHGELVFANTAGDVRLTITGKLTSENDGLPEGVELTGEGPYDSITQLRGYFIEGKQLQVVGTVVALKNDLAKQPPGTSGPFLLYADAGRS
jgi:hypothetical protein